MFLQDRLFQLRGNGYEPHTALLYGLSTLPLLGFLVDSNQMFGCMYPILLQTASLHLQANDFITLGLHKSYNKYSDSYRAQGNSNRTGAMGREEMIVAHEWKGRSGERGPEGNCSRVSQSPRNTPFLITLGRNSRSHTVPITLL